MENPKTPESLESKNPDLELLEEGFAAPDLLTLIESSNGLGSIFNVQLRENGNAVAGDRLAMDVKGNGVSVIETAEYCLLNDVVDKMEEGQIGMEVDRGSGMKDDAVIESVKDEGTKGVDRLTINGVDSVNKVQVSGDNISLFVDFSGTLNEVNRTGLMLSEYELKEAGNEVELVTVGPEHKFYVGDIVWVRTKSLSWWSGKILDPSEAPEYALVGEEKNCLLVGYFGFSHFAWCCPSQLKPFLVNFEQMIRQNKARSFLAAVEKAMDDFGKCLKSEMMCSCVLKENKLLSNSSASKEGVSLAEGKSGQLAEFSAARFETVKFLCQLKNLAQVVRKPDMLEFVVLQSYLSAFYCSVGHCQLPLHQLWETTCDAENAEKNSIPNKFLLEQSDVMQDEMLQLDQNAVSAKTLSGDRVAFSSKQALTSRKRKRKIYDEVRNSNTPFEMPDQGTCVSVKNRDDNSEPRNELGYEFRGRKKSKYLSYPYVKLEGKVSGETEDSAALKVTHERVNEFIGSSSADKRSAKKFQKTWYRKFIGGNDVTAFPELSGISSAELLSELHILAVDCLFSTESKTFGLFEWFFSRFRISVYHDESIYEMHCKNMASEKEATVKNPCLSGNDLLQTKPTSSPLTLHENKRQKKKKPTISITSNINSLSGTLDGNINFLPCNLSVKVSEAMASDIPNGKQTHLETKHATNIPDLNGDGAVTPSSIVADGNNASSGLVLLDFQAVGPHSVKTVIEQSNREGLNVVLPDSGATIPPLTIPNLVSFASESKPDQKKKRIRKPKAQSGLPSPMPSSNIPDLNGTGAEPNMSIKDLQEANDVPPAKKPSRKRRKKGEVILGTPNMILDYNGGGASGKAPATTLLLTFTPGASMPSKEVLVATFSRFGSLKESELQILKDSSTARIIFMRSNDAAKALQSLEGNNPFGATLTKYHLQNDNIVTTKRTEGFRLPANLTSPVSVPRLGDAPPNIDFMRKNLVMMTSMLEKSGDNLPLEMKAKLENEIKGLLKKVSSCPGSSM
ncbi:Ubiquitin-specific protease 12 isoform 1 [Hibiscus syriacus]|uniref:Ubiquitin-specific protease 12 isoform 1 n=1 Tax=Hibiscus syriacus TaxID=106335 RepID=A0A6A3C6H1_HIBSY|nr:serine/threonine-protein kinase ATM-like [Hibiscus syriacus]XP_039060175.1 serine/threonine-protein kinase ATM-like [Hibiscus syriacus]KAE8724324.1 Ubiquitin-specific protease 12 isoform 1 [Hibiscus syriacus]